MSALDLSIGCILIGVILNVWLYGFSCLQFYLYYANFRSDRAALKAFVAFLFVADTANAVFDLHFIYDYLVTRFGDLKYASVSNWSFTTDPVVTSIIAFSCQMFFAWRVHRLTKSFIWPVIIAALSFASLLGAIGTTIGVSIVLKFAEFQKFQAVVIVWLLCAALADIVITISLILTLKRSRTGFQATDDLITKLIRTTIQTGAVTTVFAVIDLILFLASNTTLHLVFNLPLAKLYVNSLLSTLNARTAITNVIYADGHGLGTSSNTRGVGSGIRHSAFTPQVASQTSSGERKRPTILDRLTVRPGRLNRGASDLSESISMVEKGIQITTVSERFEEQQAAAAQAAAGNNDGILMSKSNTSLSADSSFHGTTASPSTEHHGVDVQGRPHSDSVATANTESTHMETLTSSHPYRG